MARDKIKILVFDQDDLSKTLIENYLQEINIPYELFKYGEFDRALIEDDGTYKFIFIDVNSRNMSVLNEVKPLVTNERYNFFFTSLEANTDLYVKSLRTGAKEFLRKPLVKLDFINAIKNSFKQEMISDLKNENKVKYITVTSNEKGVGKTFFSINLSREIAGITNEKVLLIDFNDNLNNVAFSLDIDPIIDTKEIVQNINEENAQSYISKILRYKNSSLYILSDGLYTSRAEDMNFENIEKFFKIIKKYFKYIVIDVNQEMDSLNDLIFEKSDVVYYLISSGVAASEKNKKYINSNKNGKKFKVILNKYKSKDESKLEEIESTLRKEICAKVPMSLMVTAGSSGRGKTIREINPDTDIVKTYNKIARYTIEYRV